LLKKTRTKVDPLVVVLMATMTKGHSPLIKCLKKQKRKGVGPVVIVTMVAMMKVTMNVDGNDRGSAIGQYPSICTQTIFTIYKLRNLKIKKIQSMFQNLKISKSFTMLKWGCNLHDIYIKIVIYDARNKNLK